MALVVVLMIVVKRFFILRTQAMGCIESPTGIAVHSIDAFHVQFPAKSRIELPYLGETLAETHHIHDLVLLSSVGS